MNLEEAGDGCGHGHWTPGRRHLKGAWLTGPPRATVACIDEYRMIHKAGGTKDLEDDKRPAKR